MFQLFLGGVAVISSVAAYFKGGRDSLEDVIKPVPSSMVNYKPYLTLGLSLFGVWWLVHNRKKIKKLF